MAARETLALQVLVRVQAPQSIRLVPPQARAGLPARRTPGVTGGVQRPASFGWGLQ